MKQLIYCSQPFGFDLAMLAGILATSRRNNRRDDITGALICRHDLYLQLIEGPPSAIDALYSRIAADDRHLDVKLLAAADVATRIFPEWAMLDDEAQTLFWSPAEIAAGAHEADPIQLRGVFTRLAEQARNSADPHHK